MCRVALDHGVVQGGTCPKRVASLYILQRTRSLHSWPQFGSRASSLNLYLVWQVPAQLHQHCWIPTWLHQLSPYTPFSARMAAFLTAAGCVVESWFRAGKASTSHTSPHGGPLHYQLQSCLLLPLSDPMAESPCFMAPSSWQLPPCQSALIFKCWTGTCYVSSYPGPPTMCYFCQFPHIFYLLSAAVFSQGKSTPWHRSLWLLSLTQVLYKLPPSYIMSHYTVWKSRRPFTWGGGTAIN